MPRPAGGNSYWAFLMSEKRARPHLTQEELQIHVAKMWRKGGFDSYGRPLEQVLSREAQEQVAEERRRGETREWVEERAFRGDLATATFYVIQANVFCLTEEKGVVPAEVCLARVSLQAGVEEVHHEFLDHGPLPLGYRADCLANSRRTHRIPLDLDIANGEYSSILADIRAFLGMEEQESRPPPLYLLPAHRHQTAMVLAWLHARAGAATSPFLLYSLATLLFHLARVGREVGTEVPTEILAEVQLDRDVFLYTAGMACRWHQEEDETVYCSVAVVRRWCYILLHICNPRHHLELLPGRHLPPRPPSSRATSSASTTSKASQRKVRSSQCPEIWLPPSWGAAPPATTEGRAGEHRAPHPFLSRSSRSCRTSVTSDSFMALPSSLLARQEHISLDTSLGTSLADTSLVSEVAKEDSPPPYPRSRTSSTPTKEEQASLDTSLAVSEIVLSPLLLASPPPREGHVSLDTTLATLREDILSTTLDTNILETTVATVWEDNILDTTLATTREDMERGELRLPPNLLARHEHVSLATSFTEEDDEDWVMEGLDAVEGVSLANCTLAD